MDDSGYIQGPDGLLDPHPHPPVPNTTLSQPGTQTSQQTTQQTNVPSQSTQQSTSQSQAPPQIIQPSVPQGLAGAQNLVVAPTIQRVRDTTMMRISSAKLDSKKNNWISWSQSMQNLFEMSDVVKYIEGTVPCPDPKVDLVGAKNWC